MNPSPEAIARDALEPPAENTAMSQYRMTPTEWLGIRGLDAALPLTAVAGAIGLRSKLSSALITIESRVRVW